MSQLHSIPYPGAALLTTREAAATLALSSRTVRRMVTEGELPAVRFGRAVRFRPSDLTALVDRRAAKAG